MRKQIFAALAAALTMTSSANASKALNGQITGFVLVGNNVYVFTNAPRDALPGCAASYYPGRWAFDGTTAAGQAMYSALLTAHGLHEPVSIYGIGSCTVSGDTETIAGLVTNNVQ